MGYGVWDLVDRTLRSAGMTGLSTSLESALGQRRFRAANDHTPAAVESAIRHAIGSGLADWGDYYEFGVGRGFTFWHAQRVASDSFKGPPGTPVGPTDAARGAGQPSLRYVHDMLLQHGVDWNRTIVVPGYFEDTLTDALRDKHELRPAAVVLIDCGHQASMTSAIAFLSGHLMDRAVVIVEEGRGVRADPVHADFARLFEDALRRNGNDWTIEPLYDYHPTGRVFSVRGGTAAAEAWRVAHG
jgi:O-methyltransferase